MFPLKKSYCYPLKLICREFDRFKHDAEMRRAFFVTTAGESSENLGIKNEALPPIWAAGRLIKIVMHFVIISSVLNF